MVESGQAKKHVLCSAGTVAGTGCKALACALAVKSLDGRRLAANGQPVWFVAVYNSAGEFFASPGWWTQGVPSR